MAWTDKFGQGLALNADQAFLKGDALVARKDRLTGPDHTVAVANDCRNVRDLIALRL